MTSPFGRYFRCAVLVVACLIAFESDPLEAQAGGWVVPLAQAAPVAQAARPAGRMYVAEGIVVVVLFAGAIFAVCRSSSRT